MLFECGTSHIQVVLLMLPLKYDLVKLGGSWAQRQVFSVTLIHAAIRSNQLPLALALIAELKVWYGLAPLNDVSHDALDGLDTVRILLGYVVVGCPVYVYSVMSHKMA